MAVVPMLKVTVLGHGSVMDDAVIALQRAGALDITAEPSELEAEVVLPEDERRRSLEEYAADANFVKDFLGRYHVVDQPFSAFISEKFHMTAEEFDRIEPDKALLDVYKQCVRISDRLAHIDRERARLNGLIVDLAPWNDVHVQISSLRGTQHAALFAGTVPSGDAAAIRQTIRDASPYVTVDEYGSGGNRSAWIVMVHRCCVEEVRSALAGTGFQEMNFEGLEDYPAEESARAGDELEKLAEEQKELGERATELSNEYFPHAVAVSEAIASGLDALLVRERFGRTERTFVIHGWARKASRDDLEKALAPLGKDFDLAFAEPTDEDNPPVELHNRWFIKPFETLTDLYGRPTYRELDPTPILAPFFMLFFGICIGDVGYGLALMIGAYLIKTKLDVAPGVVKFMNLLMFGGGAAILVGILTGSYFAYSGTLPPFLASLVVLSPMAQLTTFLLVTIALGVIQVVFGVLVAAYDAARKSDISGAINDQLSTLFFFAMIAVAVVVPGATTWALVLGIGIAIIMKGHTLEVALLDPELSLVDKIAGGLWLISLLAFMLALAFGGPIAYTGYALLGISVLGLGFSKGVRQTVVAFLLGLYGVYGLSAFIGDTLSYMRLAALGLSGALVGDVFNRMTGMVWSISDSMFPQGGIMLVFGALVIVIAILIFTVGHTFNVVINLLGAFVHPARLQFVEFFGKFYEGGGRAFDPFRFRTKSVVLDAGQKVRQEGGART